MTIKSENWERIRYVTFSAFFIMLVVMFWVYSYEGALTSNGAQTTIYPYRGYTALLVLISILLFWIFVYSSFRAHNKD